MVGFREARGADEGSREVGAVGAAGGLELVALLAGEKGGTRGVAGKCRDISKSPDGEGSLPAR